jgi:signal-transduction protein with cAMP-binding, CBS, and nucleotidyltransferase domain
LDSIKNDFYGFDQPKNPLTSKFNIQALEDTVLLIIKSDKMKQLYKQFPNWQQFGRQI